MAGISEQQLQKGSEANATEAPSAAETTAANPLADEREAESVSASQAARADEALTHGPSRAAGNEARNGGALGIEDVRFMRRAIELAWRGAGWTNPNPLVGCVIVRDGRVIGEGWHARYGHEHAERNALTDCARRATDASSNEQPASFRPSHSIEQQAEATTNIPGAASAAAPMTATGIGHVADPACGFAQGATAYVTLEPCCHTGKQPPCTEALIAAGIARLVVGSHDPNPLVAGKGCEALRAAGIHVDTDVLRDECDALNTAFFHFITHKTPYVVAKWAMSADGKIACATGDARWVTGPEARADGHELRHRLAAICVGINTVLADDPLLTCRREGAKSSQPARIVLDSQLRIPEDCALVRSCAAGEAPLVVATCAELDGNGSGEASQAAAKAARLRACGVEVLAVAPDKSGRVCVSHLVRELGQRGIDSLLVEGGAGVLAAFFEAGLVNEAVAYIAPKVVGGSDAPGPVSGTGACRMADAVALGRATSDVLGDDVKLMFAPAGTARVCAQTSITRKAAAELADKAEQGGAPCSPAS